jgi:hypothetical protein
MFLSPNSARKEPAETIYPGKPLQQDEIRLISLQPGRWNDQITCELTNVPLDASRYRALSYVWGSQKVVRTIRLNGHAYSVTVNLESALRHLREKYKEGLVLWVDALYVFSVGMCKGRPQSKVDLTCRCINQKDIQERTEQVQLMDRIYEKCYEGIVYLGDQLENKALSADPPPVLHFDRDEPLPGGERNSNAKSYSYRMPAIHRVFTLFWDLSRSQHLYEIPVFGGVWWEKSWSDLKRGNKNRLELFEALRRFMQPPFTPWFNRIWVVQEVTAPCNVVVVYGTVSAPWTMFATAASEYKKHSTTCCADIAHGIPKDEEKTLTDSCNKVSDIHALRIVQHAVERRSFGGEREDEFMSLLGLLRRFRDRKASDPRDKVYALLSMARTPHDRAPLLPDYSLSEVEVFTQATMESIYATESLSVFSTELGRKFRKDLPSWVPDWGAPGGNTYASRTEAMYLYHACLEKATPTSVRLNHSVLQLKGKLIFRVAGVGEVMWGDNADHCQETLRMWWSLYLQYMLSRRMWQDFYCHWFQNFLPERDQATTRDSARPCFRTFWQTICADVMYESQTNSDVRRTQPQDELNFAAWASFPGVPFFREKNESFEFNWTKPLDILRCVLFLWPDEFVLDSCVQSTTDHTKRFYPSKLVKDPLEGARVLDQLVAYLDPSFHRAEIFEGTFKIRSDAPWKKLLIRAREYLLLSYGDNAELDLKKRASFLPAIDKSIITATRARRLICGNGLIGLGPANTERGDEVYLLTGGKTPFVLRRSKPLEIHEDGKEANVGPRFEIIGDCYVQGWMDGMAENSSSSEWIDISFV